MTVYLIRHGATMANERHLYCGKTDLPLSAAGRETLGRLALPGDICYVSSGLRRCNETLERLFGDVPYAVDPAFREMDFGIFEMKGYQELRDTPEYQAWLTGDNEANIAPGGESGEQMTCRVLAAFRQVWDTGRDTAIVTHGGVIAAIMADLFPQEGKNRYQWQPKPGGGYRVTQRGYQAL